MTTIASFSKPEEAHLLRLRLEAGGVAAYIQDENMIQLDWMYSNAIGGVKVQIAEEDIDDAREILNEQPIDSSAPETPPCPFCLSENIQDYELPRRTSYLSFLLLGFPLLLSRNNFKCSDCGRKWR